MWDLFKELDKEKENMNSDVIYINSTGKIMAPIW